MSAAPQQVGGTFFEFWTRVQQQRQPQQPDGALQPATSALPADSGGGAAPAASGAAAPSEPRAGAAPAVSAAAPAGSNAGGLSADVDWDELRNARLRVGPQLGQLRQEQRSNPEGYSVEHARRLCMYPPSRPYRQARRNLYCKDEHGGAGANCRQGCKTCHFCRQRTVERKTRCCKCEGRSNRVGGPGRGYWCGSCLWLRVGENIDDVRDRADWVCPACREICNCSGKTCVRAVKGWFPTQQLAHEAHHMGFQSVAHYLVLTKVSDEVAAAPIADTSALARRPTIPQRQREEPAVGDLRAFKRRRLEQQQRELEDLTRQRMESELHAVLAELGGGSGVGASGGTSFLPRYLPGSPGALGGLASSSGGGSSGLGGGGMFLHILDAAGEEEDEGGDFLSPGPAAGAASGAGPGRLGAAGSTAAASGSGRCSSYLQAPPLLTGRPHGSDGSGGPLGVPISGAGGTTGSGTGASALWGIAASSGSGDGGLAAAVLGGGRGPPLLMLPPRQPPRRQQQQPAAAGGAGPWQQQRPLLLAEPAASGMYGAASGAGQAAAGGQPEVAQHAQHGQQPLLHRDTGADYPHLGLPSGGGEGPTPLHAQGARPAEQRLGTAALLAGLGGLPFGQQQQQRRALQQGQQGRQQQPEQQQQQRSAWQQQRQPHMTPGAPRQLAGASAAQRDFEPGPPLAKRQRSTSAQPQQQRAGSAVPEQQRGTSGAPGKQQQQQEAPTPLAVVGGGVALRVGAESDPAALAAIAAADPSPHLYLSPEQGSDAAAVAAGPDAQRSQRAAAGLAAAAPSTGASPSVGAAPSSRGVDGTPAVAGLQGAAAAAATGTAGVGSPALQQQGEAPSPAGSGHQDELRWGLLLEEAQTAVVALQHAYRMLPANADAECPCLLLFGEAHAEQHYQQQHDTCVASLQQLLRRACRLLRGSAAVLNKWRSSDPVGSSGMDSLTSHNGLRRCCQLLNMLASCLPAEDVQWQIQPVLLCKEPFLDFARCDTAARTILLRAQLQLLSTLRQRGLPTEEAAATITQIAMGSADILSSALPLLDALAAIHTGAASSVSLPTRDFQLGPFHYDTAARDKPSSQLLVELTGLYAQELALLGFALEQLRQCCLGSAAGPQQEAQRWAGGVAFLTPELLGALLSGARRYGGAVKTQALALVCAALEAASPRHDASDAVHLSANAHGARQRQRQALCQLLQGQVVPLLEALTQQDYPMWRSAGARGGGGEGAGLGASGPAAAAGLGVGSLSSDAERGEEVGSEKVETLAACYAFLLECGQLTWTAVEGIATRPYSYGLFWRQANPTYRGFALVLLACTLSHAPSILHTPVHAAGVLRLWLQSLTDWASRRYSWLLTQVLASHEATAPLFESPTPADLAALRQQFMRDPAGQGRAALAGAVARGVCAAPAWRQQLGLLLGDLDEVLAARPREIAGMEMHPDTAVARWQGASARIVMAVVLEAAGLVPVPSTLLHPGTHSAGVLLGRGGASGGGAAAGGGSAEAALVGRLLKQLTYRVAVWAVGGAAAVKRAFAAAHNRSGDSGRPAGGLVQQQGPGGAAEHDAEEAQGQLLRTLADVRLALQHTPMALLPELWAVLLRWGAPAVLESDPALQLPLWTVVAAVLELGSGEVEATAADAALFESLAKSLAPTAEQLQQAPWAAAALPHHPSTTLSQGPLEQALQGLRAHVLGGHVRRACLNGSMRHASYARLAVNALRFSECLVGESALRSDAPLASALRQLLPPLLEVVHPLGPGAVPQPGVKHAAYRLLGVLLQAGPPWLLPPPAALTEQQQQGVALPPGALRAFWLAAARDVVGSVASLLPADKRQKLLAKAQASDAPRPPLLVLPLDAGGAAEASRALTAAFGLQRSREGFEALCRQQGGALQSALAPPGLLAGALAGASGGPGGDSALFRPGDFGWKVGGEALLLIAQLASHGCAAEACSSPPPAAGAASLDGGAAQGSSAGRQWASGCFHTVHYLLAFSGRATEPLHRPYKQLRQALTQMLGPQLGITYKLRTQAPPPQAMPAARRAAPAPSVAGISARQQLEGVGCPPQRPQAHLPPQEQRPSNQPLPAGAQQQQQQQQQRGQQPAASPPRVEHCAGDLELRHLGLLAPSSTLPLTAWAWRKPVIKPSPSGNPVLELCFKDGSRLGGRSAQAKVLVTQPEVMAALQRGLLSDASYDWGAPWRQPLLVHLTSLLLLSAGGPQCAAPVLKSTTATKVEIQPGSTVAERIRRSIVSQVSAAALTAGAATQQQGGTQGTLATQAVGVALQGAAEGSQQAPGSVATPRFHWHAQQQLQQLAAGRAAMEPPCSQMAEGGGDRGPSQAAAPGGAAPAALFGTQVACSQAGPSGPPRAAAGAVPLQGVYIKREPGLAESQASQQAQQQQAGRPPRAHCQQQQKEQQPRARPQEDLRQLLQEVGRECRAMGYTTQAVAAAWRAVMAGGPQWQALGRQEVLAAVVNALLAQD